MSDPDHDQKARLLAAALPHVPFDGWSSATLNAAAAESGIDPVLAQAWFPRGGIDLALAFHAAGDRAMVDALAALPLDDMRIRDKVTRAVRTRIEQVGDKELVRKGTTLMALPQYAADGARALWQTADHIWVALGDESDDLNWYSKRATLSAVYSATVLYWLGDESPDANATWAFLDRRIDNVMQVEKVKHQIRTSPLLGPFARAAGGLFGRVRAPARGGAPGLPGRFLTDLREPQ